MRAFKKHELVNTSAPYLIVESLKNRETNLSKDGAVMAYTGEYTGRAANDKFIVADLLTADTVDWTANKPFTPEAFDKLQAKVESYFQEVKPLYVQRLYAGVDFKATFEVTTTTAWHALFAKTMFYDLPDDEDTEWKLLHAPDFHADPDVDGTNSKAFIILNYSKKVVLIGGTHYAGEIKKSVFTILNFTLPSWGILPMHSSVNVGRDGGSAVFFGLSGTGKTTLSADPNRILVGDDEHGWNDNGVFNFEDGCYAKAINLSKENEPEIWQATNSFGSVLENVIYLNDKCEIDFSSNIYTENTRAAYKLNKIPNASVTRKAPHPNNIIMLTCDAYGILPPVSLLTANQAVYYFLSGYTAKVAGTEAGVKEPTATFSTCFGAPFLPRHPTKYASLFLKKIQRHDVKVWLVNTGWIGGPYGVGNRISLLKTRAIVSSILDGTLYKSLISGSPTNMNISYVDSTFGFVVPTESWIPTNDWEDKTLFETKTQELVNKFKNNFKKYALHVSPGIVSAGPR
jgi:phosphoenolpyruvate carboxykinase (ATP)